MCCILTSEKVRITITHKTYFFMKNTRLNLAEFKARAENTNTNKILEKVQGGDMSSCHGYWGQLYKEAMVIMQPVIDGVGKII